MSSSRNREVNAALSNAAMQMAQHVVALHYNEDAEQLNVWLELEEQTQDLVQASTNILHALQEQQETVDRVEAQYSSAQQNTIQGAKQIVSADDTRSKGWKWKAGSGGALVGGAIGIVGGPVGVAVGSAVGVTVGATLASLPRWFVRKDVQKSQDRLDILQNETGTAHQHSSRDDQDIVQDMSDAFQEREALGSTWHDQPSSQSGDDDGRETLQRQQQQHSSRRRGGGENDPPRIVGLKLSCLENVLQAMNVTIESSQILQSDKDALLRVELDDAQMAKAQEIADRHIRGLESNWFMSFFRFHGIRSSRSKYSAKHLVKQVESETGKKQSTMSAAEKQALLKGNDADVEDDEADEVVDEIHKILRQLKVNQSDIGDEISHQNRRFERLSMNADRRATKAKDQTRRAKHLC